MGDLPTEKASKGAKVNHQMAPMEVFQNNQQRITNAENVYSGNISKHPVTSLITQDVFLDYLSVSRILSKINRAQVQAVQLKGYLSIQKCVISYPHFSNAFMTPMT